MSLDRNASLHVEPMSPAELQRYKKRLLEKQQELFGEPDAEARVPQAGGLQGDLIDQANADAEAELQIRLHQADSHLLRAIDDALGRMRRGTYGVCEVCRKPIPKGRLEAVPWARHCRDCKEHKRPAA
jgi:DnaK suppressor protein